MSARDGTATSTALRVTRGLSREHLVLLALSLGLVLVGTRANPAFATPANLANVIGQSAPLGLVALGQTLVVLVGGVDLSIGASVSALGVLLALLCERFPESAIALTGLTLVAGVAMGLLNAALTLGLRLHPLVVTIGTGAILNGATLMAARQPSGTVPDWMGDIAFGGVAGMPHAGLFMLLAFAVSAAWLRRTRGGLHLLAVGGSPNGARLAGIPPARLTLLAFALSGLCSACAAVYLTARTGTGDPLAGEPLTLASLTPVVVGGTVLGGGKGSLLGTLLGVLMLSLLGNIFNYMNVSTFLQWTLQGFIIIAAVFFQARRPGTRA